MSRDNSSPDGLSSLATAVSLAHPSDGDAVPSAIITNNTSVFSAALPVALEQPTLVRPADDQATTLVACSRLGAGDQSTGTSVTYEAPSPTTKIDSHDPSIPAADDGTIQLKAPLPDSLTQDRSHEPEPRHSNFGVQTVPIIMKRGT